MSVREAFEPLRIALETAEIRYAIGGSWASTLYGEARFTNDVDVLADFTAESLTRFLAGLPGDYYADRDEATQALQFGRPFNVIYMPTAFKFDFFPAGTFPLGSAELDRAVVIHDTGLSNGPVPFVSPEDILLAKLDWFRAGGEVSEVQWRDILGLVRASQDRMDIGYLEHSAAVLGVGRLLRRALSEADLG